MTGQSGRFCLRRLWVLRSRSRLWVLRIQSGRFLRSRPLAPSFPVAPEIRGKKTQRRVLLLNPPRKRTETARRASDYRLATPAEEQRINLIQPPRRSARPAISGARRMTAAARSTLRRAISLLDLGYRVGELGQVSAEGIEQPQHRRPPEVALAALNAGGVRGIDAGVAGDLRQTGRWAPSTAERYERIVRLYIDGQSSIGTLALGDVTVDHVAAWSRANEDAFPRTARMTLVTLNQVCRFAVRRGWLTENPVAKLEPAERPRRTRQPVSILEGDDLAYVLSEAGSYRTLFEFLAYTGLRIGEALGPLLGRHRLRRRVGPRPPPAFSPARASALEDRGGQARGDPRPGGREAPARTLARHLLQGAGRLRVRQRTRTRTRLPRCRQGLSLRRGAQRRERRRSALAALACATASPRC